MPINPNMDYVVSYHAANLFSSKMRTTWGIGWTSFNDQTCGFDFNQVLVNGNAQDNNFTKTDYIIIKIKIIGQCQIYFFNRLVFRVFVVFLSFFFSFFFSLVS